MPSHSGAFWQLLGPDRAPPFLHCLPGHPGYGDAPGPCFTSELAPQSVLPLPDGWRYAFLGVRMQRKIFWMTFAALGLMADLVLPFWWAVGATLPILALSWWIAYRSDWF